MSSVSDAGSAIEERGEASFASGWVPVGLLVPAFLLSVFDPWVLIGVPYLALVFALARTRIPGLAVALAIAILVLGRPDGPVWYIERAWALLLAGWFVAVTLRWPTSSVTARALGSIAGAAALAAAVLLVRPGSWEVLDWLVDERIRESVSASLQVMTFVRSETAISSALATTAYQIADAQSEVFPALVGLSSAASLGVAWWLFFRFGRGRRDALAPLKQFRFEDQLVWVVIVGLALVLAGDALGGSRAGLNALVFMGGLYAVRGTAVFAWFVKKLSFAGVLLLVIGFVMFWPVVVLPALVIGVSDTWLDLRGRAGRLEA